VGIGLGEAAASAALRGHNVQNFGITRQQLVFQQAVLRNTLLQIVTNCRPNKRNLAKNHEFLNVSEKKTTAYWQKNNRKTGEGRKDKGGKAKMIEGTYNGS
jgi:hypothetical protein